MKKIEDECVGCPTEMGCLGKSCPYRDVSVYYCDDCNDYADYEIDGIDYCESCAKVYLKDCFDELTIVEQSEALNIPITKR